MDTIPPEILLHILSHLDIPLSRYAGVCRAFQYLIEIKTFENIAITSTIPQIQRLDSVFGDERRRYLLRKLEFTVSLPHKLKNNRKRPLKYLRDKAFTQASITIISTCNSTGSRDFLRWNVSIHYESSPYTFSQATWQLSSKPCLM